MTKYDFNCGCSYCYGPLAYRETSRGLMVWLVHKENCKLDNSYVKIDIGWRFF
ncbi:MAG: hypothetical protein PHP92_03550 [Candidatus Nanoarchaeia archaeon]|nr:hypothetical protein [Candidatus Nanoarchaeia archaeon]